MKQGYIEILDLDFEYKLWKNDLQYYLEQIKVIEDRFVVLTREQIDWKPDVKHQLVIDNQKQTIQKLQKVILNHEKEIAFYASDYPITAGHSHYTIHEDIRNELEKISFRQKEIMADLISILSYPVQNTDRINL